MEHNLAPQQRHDGNSSPRNWADVLGGEDVEQFLASMRDSAALAAVRNIHPQFALGLNPNASEAARLLWELFVCFDDAKGNVEERIVAELDRRGNDPAVLFARDWLTAPDARFIYAKDATPLALKMVAQWTVTPARDSESPVKSIFDLRDENGETPVITSGHPTTDTGNAERFIEQHGHKFLIVPGLGAMVWDGCRYVPDDRGMMGRWEKSTVRSIHLEAITAKNDTQRQQLGKWAFSSESEKARRAMAKLIEKDGPRATPADFDANRMMLNLQNGILDLETGELLPHDRTQRISKLSSIRYDAKATCPLWLATLRAIFNGDENLMRFFQCAVGYSLTGITREQCFFILHGGGANGKSLVLHILRSILGDYQEHAPAATLMQKRADAIPNDVAKLRGARLVTSIETNEGRRLDEALVKALTGDDPITARFFRQEFFTFHPQFKIFLATNHKPQIAGTDDGIWRRIRLIPFGVRFWDADKGESGEPHLKADKTLAERIEKTELSGVLNWALEGCLSWQRSGLPSPKAVRDATGQYRDESDPVAQFLEDCAVCDPNLSITKSDFHKAYSRWAKDNDLSPMSSKLLSRRMIDGKFEDFRATGGVRMWRGIALLTPDTEKSQKGDSSQKEREF
jgi:putative DNA primase/helicase